MVAALILSRQPLHRHPRRRPGHLDDELRLVVALSHHDVIPAKAGIHPDVFHNHSGADRIRLIPAFAGMTRWVTLACTADSPVTAP